MFGRRGRREESQINAEITQRYMEALRSTESRIVLQEIFSKPHNETKPVKEQEFAELRIDDWTESYRPGFAVTEWRIRWSEIDQQFMWEDEQQELWSALQTAKNRYEARRVLLTEQGFSHSDMDF